MGSQPVQNVSGSRDDGVAVIGIACRFPKAATVEGFWELLVSGTEAVDEVPPHRESAFGFGASSLRRAGYLDDIDQFDPTFFAIEPGEAGAIDPQQRLMLELGWEVIEDAGIRAETVRRRRLGVFVGSMWDDYSTVTKHHGIDQIDGYTTTGIHRSIIANRLSRFLQVSGPSVVIDTGQSSSLVAVHLACRSLRTGESELAIAGGVNIIASPEGSQMLAEWGGLSPDGKCYAFDARANGFVRGEGAGAVLLKPLSDALRDGDQIYCVIRGSAMGSGSGDTLATPDEEAQREVLSLAYEDARIAPSDAQYVELHGTGTAAGDPIEANALSGAMSSPARQGKSPLLVGSVKTNIGHLEGAAGIAGFIKTALSIRHHAIPPSLNFEQANPAIPLDELGIDVQREFRDWPTQADSIVAGVSSFGMGGVNCHIVLTGRPATESMPSPEPPRTTESAQRFGGLVPWVVSGRGVAALRGQAARLATVDTSDVHGVGWSLLSRSLLPDRAVVWGTDQQELMEGLAAVATGQPGSRARSGRAADGGLLGVVFSGQGSQRVGMGRRLYACSPVFAAAFDEVCGVIDPLLRTDLREAVASGEGLDSTGVAQPALFAVEVALFRLLESWGVVADVVLGHSVGEISAAHVAGVLSLEDACVLVAARARLMQALPAGGAMAAIAAGVDEVAPLLSGRTDQVGLAAVNGPSAVVVSGETTAVDEVAETMAGRGHRVRKLRVSHAFHSPLIEPMLGEFEQAIQDLRFEPPQLTVISTVTGQPVAADELGTPEYWVDQARRTVRFADAALAAHAHGVRSFVELGPDPVCATMIADCLDDPSVTSVAALHRDHDDAERFMAAVAELFVRGVPVDWQGVFHEENRRRVPLPTYAFQRQRFWLGSSDNVVLAGAEPSVNGSSSAPWPDDDARSLVGGLILEHSTKIVEQEGRTDFRRDATFNDLGFDSVRSVELRNSLSAATGVRLPAAVLFDYPTPAALEDFLVARLTGAAESSGGVSGVEVVSGTDVVDDPVVVVGVGCRFPGGVVSGSGLWGLVDGGRDVVSGWPVDRGWDVEGLFDPDPDAIGKSYVRDGGFLHDAADFDAAFFGISPREALAMDPQQRLLLEVAWEALEDAGIDPMSLRGSETGVFTGATALDYGPRWEERVPNLEGLLLTGTTSSVASGRVAYCLGLVGPAVSVDTACSSSLVALHLGVQSLRLGECGLALVGGVTVMSTPQMFVEFSRQRGLSVDGRCKSFAAAADGVGWSEGVGLVVLERLSDARRNGHDVLAVVAGSAVNQDGASNGLTAPNGPSQQRVIRSALANAGLGVGDVDVVEAHGTGTRLGDPIEAEALLATYGQGRNGDGPVWLGSVKSNLGHTQAAAGVAGVIKMVMAMRHGVLPATLHVDAPSPHVDWESGAVQLLTEPVDWPAGGEKPRRAGVSSFGISGTNAHVILEEPPRDVVAVEELDRPARSVGFGGLVPWVVSGRGVGGLRGQARRLAEWATTAGVGVGGVGLSLLSRAVLEDRAVVWGRDTEGLIEGLAAVAAGDTTSAGVVGLAAGGGVGVVFSGQGSQRVGMGRGLLEASPVFAAAFDEVCGCLNPLVGRDVAGVVASGEGLDETGMAQPALFAVEVALFRLLESWGVRPDVLMGHSVGEISAAHVAGVLSLRDACVLVAARSRLMQALPAGGAMTAVGAGVDVVAPLLVGRGQLVSVAAVNGPASVVISGEAAAVREVADQLAADGCRVRDLRVSHAFHSPLVEPMLAEFEREIAGLEFRSPTVTVISTLTGQAVDAERFCTPRYWVDQVRQPVRFADATRAAYQHGVRKFVELGPDPVCTSMIHDTLSDTDATAVAVLRRDHDDVEQFLSAAAQLFVNGVDVDWRQLFAGEAGRVPLPSYAFQRTRYWLSAGATDVGSVGTDHPLLWAVVEMASGGVVLTGRLGLQSQPWLGDHQVMGTVVVPGTVFVEWAIAAGDRIGCPVVDELTLTAPLILPETGSVDIQITATPHDDDAGGAEITVHSRPHPATDASNNGNGNGAGAGWVQHATGTLTTDLTTDIPEALGVWPPADATEVAVDDAYERLAERGYEYGPVFQGLQRAWRTDAGDVYADVVLPEDVVGQGDGFVVHPALLDASLHALLVVADGGVVLPFSWAGAEVLTSGATRLRVRLSPQTGTDSTSVVWTDTAGQPVARVRALTMRPVNEDGLRGSGRARRDDLYARRWQRLPINADDDVLGSVNWVGVASESPAGFRVVGANDWYASVAALREEVGAGAEPPPVVVVPVDGGGGGVVGGVHQATGVVLGLVQEWLADERLTDSRLVFVLAADTSTVLVEDGQGGVGDEPDGLVSAAVAGLVRSAQTENPGRFVLVHRHRDVGAVAVGRWLPAALAADEPEVLLTGEALCVPRLVRVPVDGEAGEDLSAGRMFDAESTVLITGGSGVLAGVLAEHLVTGYGVRHVLLVSRRGEAADETVQLVQRLQVLGAQVSVAACDVSDRDALAGVIDAIPEKHPLRAVVHAAGLLDDAVAMSMTVGQLDRVLAPKVDAAWHLHELTRHLGLAGFVVYSSVSGVVGGAGQANYAAGNAFLDALAVHRRGLGLPGLSLAWGLWDQASGLTGHLDRVDVQRMARSGLLPMGSQAALELFDAGLGLGLPVVVPARLEVGAGGGSVPAVLRGLVRSSRRRSVAGQGSGWRDRLVGLGGQQRLAEVVAVVRGEVAAVLGHGGAGQIDLGRAFTALGFDSLTAVELRNRLKAITGLSLPTTVVFDYPNTAALADYLLTELFDEDEELAAPGVGVVSRADVDDDPIVVVGLGCRFPGGVASGSGLWGLVDGGRDVVSGWPVDRGWDVEGLFDPDPDAVGKSYVREGGFLHDAADFDAGFFGISPREALAMDPQQRLLLEVAWEALEDAGIDPTSLRDSETGIFAGQMYHDYVGQVSGVGEVEGSVLTGNAGSVLSGRVAYCLGLVGPAVSVDTACSSSLVALHLGVQSLRLGECGLALVGGVTVMSTPSTFVEFSRQRGLAMDGRCKSFSAAADGVGWSEGVGLVVLERLSDARRNGHDVLAVVAGSAVNQDGASNGLTAPNGPSQQRVIRAALANAGLSTTDVDVVEAHGTGTRLGDPIEAEALLATYGKDRNGDGPLWLGSVKSNLGHTQAAAGMASVIKMVMAMRHGVLPRTLHVDAPSPHVDWESGSVRLLTEPVDWPAGGEKPRRAGVSSFGISGTNAHVILEEPPRDMVESVVEGSTVPGFGGWVPWVVSGRGVGGLRGQVGRLAEWAATDGAVSVGGVGLGLLSRAVLEDRAVVWGRDVGELVSGLQGVAASDATSSSGVVGSVGGSGVGGVGCGVVFVFAGQGSQWLGMGRGLLGVSSVFDSVVGECDVVLGSLVGWSVRDVLLGVEGAPSLDRVDVVQPVLFVVMVGLARVWESWGVVPDVVVGHSQGEIAAACVAGGLSLGDGLRVVVCRSRLLGLELAGSGGMVSVGLSRVEVEGWLGRWGGRVSVAAVNGPGSVVVSGEVGVCEELVGLLGGVGVRVRRIAVDYAAHSSQVERVREGLLAELAGIRPVSSSVSSSVRMFSTVTGGWVDLGELDAGYWYRNLREPVEFEGAVRGLVGAGFGVFVEVSPHPVLTVGIEDTIDQTIGETTDAAGGEAVEEHRRRVVVVGTLRRDHDDAEQFLAAAAQLFVHGVDVDWRQLFTGTEAARVSLPSYAFQRKRYWSQAGAGGSDVPSLGLVRTDHSLLGAVVEMASGGVMLTGRLSLAESGWLGDHQVLGTVVVPGTVFVEWAIAAGDRIGCPVVDELTLTAPLVLPEAGLVDIQITAIPHDDDAGGAEIAVHSRPHQAADASSNGNGHGAGWVQHATGTLVADTNVDLAATEGLQVWPPAGATELPVADVYEQLAERGYEYGPTFQGLQRAWRGDSGDVYADVVLPDEAVEQDDGFVVHPALLDASLHALLVVGDGELVLPFSWAGVQVFTSGATRLRVRLSQSGTESTSVVLTDTAGQPVARVQALTTRPVDPAALTAGSSKAGASDSLFQRRWTAVSADAFNGAAEATSTIGTASWVGLGTDSSVSAVVGGWFADVPALRQAIDDGRPVPPVVIAVVDSDVTEDSGVVELVHQRTRQMLELTQQWLADARFTETKLVVLVPTNGHPGSESDATDQTGLVGSAVAGLMRSVHTENPGRVVVVAIDTTNDTPGDIGGWWSLVVAGLGLDEPELLVSGGQVLVPRLARADGDVLTVPDSGPWRLEVTSKGSLDNLVLVPRPEVTRPLDAGQVRIAVRAAGLNFRDVLLTLGVVDQEGLGGEAAGVVLGVGAGVTGFSPGDRVFGMFPDSIGPVAIADHRTIAPMPEGWSFAEAASVPVVFLTAYHGLVDLGGLRAGEAVLVHAASGGVGMAAVQLARHLGAEVFGTASAGKWDTLRSLGLDADHIASSRDLEFAQRFPRVDVVLNSLAREFVDASLDLLGPGGRFLEMGKTDWRDHAEVAAAHPGVDYRIYDIIKTDPDRIGGMLAELMELFRAGTLRPLPVSTWDIRHARAAFAHMREARHVGKNVLTIPSPDFDAESTVLITGGSGVLAGVLAEHLVAEHGVRHVLLVSRRGEQADGFTRLRDELGEQGAWVSAAACDVSDRDALAKVIASIPEQHPLRVVVHAAGVLDDAVAASMTPDQLDRVLGPKVDAGWHLHELTQDHDLTAFILYSSLAGVIGGAGQANYAAGNAFLDALAEHRHRLGLPAVSLAWGLWEQASGLTGHLDDVDVQRMARAGIASITTGEGMRLFDEALGLAAPVVVPARLETRQLGLAGTVPAIFRDLTRPILSRVRAGDGEGSSSLTTRLAALAAEQRLPMLQQLVATEVGAVLGYQDDAVVPTERALKEVGLDSLTAVELRNRLTKRTGLKLPTTLAFDYPTPTAIAKYLLDELVVDQSEETTSSIIANLDILRQQLSAVADGSARQTIVKQLREMARDYESSTEPVIDGDLDAATDDELYALIDNDDQPRGSR